MSQHQTFGTPPVEIIVSDPDRPSTDYIWYSKPAGAASASLFAREPIAKLLCKGLGLTKISCAPPGEKGAAGMLEMACSDFTDLMDKEITDWLESQDYYVFRKPDSLPAKPTPVNSVEWHYAAKK